MRRERNNNMHAGGKSANGKGGAAKRRSYLSPKGTNKNMPNAVPAWLSMAIVPTRVTDKPKVFAISASNGWM